MARTPPLPPVLFLAALVSGSLLHARWPVELLPLGVPARLALAMPLFLLAAGVTAWALATLRRAGTTWHPGETPSALVTGGPFRRSRNPLYLALLATLLGFTLLLDSVWLLLGLAALYALLRTVVVSREEGLLATRFGPAYDDYRHRVRRWL